MKIKVLADKIAKRHNTRDPFQIANDLGFIIIYAPLMEVRGFQQRVLRRNLIYINSNLDETQQRLVCAHELGHYFLHRGTNRIFMDRSTDFVSQKAENEAHKFSVDLIYSDDMLEDFIYQPIDKIANYMGVSEKIAEYRVRKISLKSCHNRHRLEQIEE